MSANEINKIYIDDNVKVENVGMSVLLFCDGKVISKKLYSIVDHVITLIDSTEKEVSAFLNQGSANYFEYKLVLTDGEVTVSGIDIFKNNIPDIITQNCMIFVDGKLISEDDYVIRDKKIVITSHYGNSSGCIVSIWLSTELKYLGELRKSNLLKDNMYKLAMYQYTSDKYVFFKNGKLIGKNKLTVIDEYTISFNIELENSDIITYYALPANTTNYFFEALPGYLSYGPLDSYNRKVPNLFDTKITFSKSARLTIDDIRVGMIVAETDGTGSAIIADDDFETPTIKCLRISQFSKGFYPPKDCYIQVPEAKSILKYVSEYDLQKTLFPELLGSFQRVLLDETYDSIQRLKNIRSITKVDREHITKLLDMLGLKIDITDMTLEQKHGILEELTNFYSMVGTRPSYNYYNRMTSNSKIIKLDQLFTPIKNGGTIAAPIYRYVTFKTAEELGAVYKKEFRTDVTDYGYVDELANGTDTLRNTSADIVRDAGILQDTNKMPVTESPRTLYVLDEEANPTTEEREIGLNTYIKAPTIGPNKPTDNYDYGFLNGIETDNYDYGSVSDELLGSWYTWYEWDRPKNYYPTNHIQLSAEIPPEMNYNEFIEEFKRVFYDIASTVLYIHNIVEIYTFGGNEGDDSGGGAGGGSSGTGGGGSGGSGTAKGGFFAVNAHGGPVVTTQEFCFTNDPERQIAPDQFLTGGFNPVIPDYATAYNKETQELRLVEYVGINPNITTPNTF